MGRKNWLFCRTELGAKHVGIMQSLIVSSGFDQIDPYDYLVDVLQRVGQHPDYRVHESTNPLYADVKYLCALMMRFAYRSDKFLYSLE